LTSVAILQKVCVKGKMSEEKREFSSDWEAWASAGGAKWAFSPPGNWEYEPKISRKLEISR